ncbi:helix-turn-helix domain-containing protein [Methylophaga thalassica]|uniref:helix-turn-helix domain-containing protein n=1 Tax=Methylophaga aminisulfidivorans TaxID=230105 RepID=UPI000681B361|nr:helix-turn-helix transcriptional regulator [Methylophaga aminisulfidivorans]
MAMNQLILLRLGNSVREYRLKSDLSQLALSNRAGVSLSTIKRLESGRGCDMVNFINVMRALGRLNDIEMLLPEIKLRPTEVMALRKKELANKKYRASKKHQN